MTDDTPLFSCDSCGMLCPRRAGDLLEVTLERGSRCSACTHRLYEYGAWRTMQPITLWEQEQWHTAFAKQYPTGAHPFLPRSTDGPPVLFPQCCVYIVQLAERHNTVKIGQTTSGRSRLTGLQHHYGALRYLLTIPHDEPWKLERQLHIRFATYRLYQGAGSSELFCFDTRRKQQVFEHFLREFATYRRDPVVWDSVSHACDEPLPQGSLFALEDL
jgi:Meiotically up-regulated gene 113